MTRQDQHSELRAILQEAGGDVVRWEYGARWHLAGTDLRGKRVLEVGSGKGLLTIFLALQDPQLVVSMEPELSGASPLVIQAQRTRIDRLGLSNVTIITDDLNQWRMNDQRFDVIVSRASINHIFESRHSARRDSQTRTRYVEIAGKFREALSPGGVALVSDACRYGLVSMMRLRAPWRAHRTSIDWRLHQNPSIWRAIFLEAGFRTADVIYPVPYPIRHLAPLVRNSTANFLLLGRFLLKATA
jgi:cyclopropane fatty-acyl-phospholipid synthase-like methyltransferase